MSITLTLISPKRTDRKELVAFFTQNSFPFHAKSRRWTSSDVEEFIDDGAFQSKERESYWIDDEQHGRIGFIRFEDLLDDTPMFDLRLADAHRGRGFGLHAVRAAVEHVFTTQDAERFEGQTRDDNVAMRTVFERAGWTLEAHYRRAWPTADGHLRDSVGYAILREDWEGGTSSGVHWHDHPTFPAEVRRDIVYSSNEVPKTEELVSLCDSAGWPAHTRSPEALVRSVLNSAHVVTARRDGKLVGLARVISDFGTIVRLQDVTVDPIVHRRGVGRHLVDLVLRPFSGLRQEVVLAEADPGMGAFYEALGFSEASKSGGPPARVFVKE